MRCNLIAKLVLLMLISNYQVFSYFITVDETKFHLVKSYLCRYGYMNENVCKQHADDSLKFMQNNARDIYRGLVIFQTMFNITRTGKIDEETIMKMAKPRCGNKDFDLQFSSSKFLSFRTNDFSILRRGLRKLTYSIKKYNPYLNRFSKSVSNEAVENLVEKAFNAWLKHLYGDVRVRKLNEIDEIYENSNITIYFAEGNHGDSMLFDGIDGELAHSCSLSNNQSPYRGHVHLDDSENWSYGNRLFSVLVHEIGHLFGLDHSSNPKSIMSPLFYFGGDGILEEDIKNLRMILGLESKHRFYEQNPTTTTTTTTTVSSTTHIVPSEIYSPKTSTTTTTSTFPTTSSTTTTTSTTSTTSSTTTTTTTTTTATTTTTTATTTTSDPTTTATTTTSSISFQPVYYESTRIISNEAIQMSSSLPAFTEAKTESDETSSEYSSDEDYITEADLESTSTTMATDKVESEELSDEVDTTAEIIINKNTDELKPYSQGLVATTKVDYPEQYTSESDHTSDFSSSASNLLNADDEYYQDELMLVTPSPDTSSKSFLTSLLDTALFHLNKTNYLNIEPSIATSTQMYTTNLKSLESSENESEEYEDSYESEDTINDSEFLELLKLIGTTTPSSIPNTYFTQMIDLSSNTTNSLNQEDIFVNQTEIIINSTNTPSTDLLEYLNINNVSFTSENETLTPSTTFQPSTTIELKTSQHLENLTSENMTTEEPIEAESTFADIVQTTQASFTTENSTEPATTFSKIVTTQRLIKTTEAFVEEPADLCNDPIVDAITRTEWGNALVFKGNYIWHIRGLTKWRLFDYEGWPKKITQLFPGLPGNIDSAYLYDDLYHFTKNQTIWKYKVVLSYPPKYLLVPTYPKLLKEEYPDMPFKSVDSAFSIATSIFFFKDYEFWQSDWNSNVTGKIPFKTNAAVSWRNPRLDSSLTEPLAYIVSNTSMYKFNYWSIPISQESLDIRYFLFDCVQANYKPHNPLFLGPSYKQAFIADDIYTKESRIAARHAPSYLARLTRNSNDQQLSENNKESSILVKNFYSSSNKISLNLFFLFSLLFSVFISF